MANAFTNFTRRNKVVKSIQFELIPEGNTRETMKFLKFEEKDAKLRELADLASPYIDDTVRTIVNHALSRVVFDFSQEEIDKSALERTIEKELSSSAKELFGITVANINSAKFISDVLPAHIETMELSAEEKAEALLIVQNLKGKTEFVSSFLITRITALTTWMPQRVIENMEIYRKNVTVFKKLFDSELGEVLKGTLDTEGFDELETYGNFLSQDGIDAYNRIINGVVVENGIETKGVRMMVNEYNLKNKNASLPMPKELYKQILMPAEASFTIATIQSDEELRELVAEANEVIKEASKEVIDVIKTAKASDMVVSYNQLHNLSHIVAENHDTLPAKVRQNELDALQELFDNATSTKERRQITKKMDSIGKELSNQEWSFEEIEDICGQINIAESYCKAVMSAYLYAKSLFDELDFTVEHIREDELAVADLKEYFDAWTIVRHLLATIRRKGTDKGSNVLYAVLEDATQKMRVGAKAESLVVAYITRKPKDVAKKELATMGTASRTGSQWLQPDGKMSINNHTILRRDGKYYYFILSPGTKPVSLLANKESDSEIFTQKKAQNAMQFLPRLTFSKAKKYFEEYPEAKECVLTEKLSRPITISRELMEIKEKDLYTIGAMKKGIVSEEEYADNLYKVLSLYKEFMEVYEEYSLFDIHLKEDLHEYRDSGEFFDDVNASNSAAMWIPADTKRMDAMVKNGTALMFLIHSRNLYTPKEKKSAYDQLFLAAMTDTSKDVYLNSNPKLFSRKASIKKPIVHKAGSILVNKTDANGDKIPEEIYEELYRYYNDKVGTYMPDLSDKTKEYIQNGLVIKKKATKDIVKDKRYTEDKWFVQFSFTKNRSVAHVARGLNDAIRSTIHERNIITVIRSETDLVYYTISSPEGKVLEKTSLNVINGRDFWKELKEISDNRKEEKSKNWKYDRKVKDQRDAYLKLAVSVLVRKVIEYDAIIVLEYIAKDRKDKMSAMDNQTMKTFEAMLINRLSDLFFLDVPAGEPGSVTNPYQLCDNTGNDFQDGIVFYTSPTYTGNVDANTGFANAFNLSRIGTSGAKKMFLSKFDRISYDKEKNRFIFDFDYDNFSTNFELPQTKWTVLAGGEKTIYDREKKFNTHVEETASSVLEILEKKERNVTEDLAKLAFDGSMTTEEANALYDIFVTAIRGIVKAHDNVPKTYISPITEEKVEYNENAAKNLTRKFLFTQSQMRLSESKKVKWTSVLAK